MAKEEVGKYNPTFEREHPASGHASREDLAPVIDQIDPDRIVHINTEVREWFADRFKGVVLAEGAGEIRRRGLGDVSCPTMELPTKMWSVTQFAVIN